ncbi:MAG: polyprenyl synthetase family protein [Bacillota bacterium]
MLTSALFRDIQGDLSRVEEELQKYVEVANPLLAETSTHLLQAGGKRLRPAFALLAGKFHNYSLDRLMPLAMALEIIHMATLVHDDVVDRSMTRRGIPTVMARWGDLTSLYVGDYLFAKSLLLIATYDDPRIASVLSRVSTEMCQGEIQQLVAINDPDQTYRDYFYRIKRKTALLISASCQLGAVAVGAPDPLIRSLRLYGYFLGMAFQITDDILDMVASEAELGKPVGSDFRQGVITLPTIYALDQGANRQRLRELVQRKEKSEEEVREALDLIRASGAVEYSFKLSQRFLEKAKEQLRKVPEVEGKAALTRIADFVGVRRF